MQRIDPAYWYRLSETVHPLTLLSGDSKISDIYLPLLLARRDLRPALGSFTTCYANAQNLLRVLEDYITIGSEKDGQDKVVYSWQMSSIANAATQFETTLKAELGISPCYLVTPKGGYNVDLLTMAPQNLFPADLLSLMPECTYDVSQIGKCLAFEVPTAAAFHLHRLNEAVLHKYWDVYTNGAARPKEKNMGVYLSALKRRTKKQAKLLSVLTQIKDLHRNPSLHPDENLTVDEAIELYGIVRSAVSRMLVTIRPPESNALARIVA